MRMSRSATPATQNGITTSFATFKKGKFCSLPHRHRDATRKPKEVRRNRLHQNEPFVRDVLKFSDIASQNRRFPTNCPHQPESQLPPKPMFRARLPPIFMAAHKMPRCHRICTLSPLDAALAMRCVKSGQHDTSEVLRLPRKMMMEVPKVLRCQENCHSSSEFDAKILPLPHEAIFETCLNATKCHACHAKRGYSMFETSESDTFCKTRHRHGHTALRQPQANRKQPQPQTPRVKREPLLRIREKHVDAFWQIMIQSVWEMTNLPCTESLPTASSGFPRLSFILNCVSHAHAMSCNARLCECLSVPLHVSMVIQCNAM